MKGKTIIILFENNVCINELTKADVIHDFNYLYPAVDSSWMYLNGEKLYVQEVQDYIFKTEIKRLVFVEERPQRINPFNKFVSSKNFKVELEKKLNFDELKTLINYVKTN